MGIQVDGPGPSHHMNLVFERLNSITRGRISHFLLIRRFVRTTRELGHKRSFERPFLRAREENIQARDARPGFPVNLFSRANKNGLIGRRDPVIGIRHDGCFARIGWIVFLTIHVCEGNTVTWNPNGHTFLVEFKKDSPFEDGAKRFDNGHSKSAKTKHHDQLTVYEYKITVDNTVFSDPQVIGGGGN